jgi:DNA-binding MarR family transcriptional regulator
METLENLNLLGLSKKEQKVLTALQTGSDTPVKLSKATQVSRTAVYAILQNLKKRGLVTSHISNGKKRFSLATEREIEETLYATKRALLHIPEGREEVHGLSDSTVIVHRGAEAVRKLINGVLSDHKHERFYGFQGDVAAINWNNVFSLEETNQFNRNVKKNGIIFDAILPDGWFERQTRELGVGWAKDFEGRTTRVNVIDQEYFKHGGQVFIFRESIYLIALGEELIIEIRNSELQRMLLSFFKFIQDNSAIIDANGLLRNLISAGEVKDETIK